MGRQFSYFCHPDDLAEVQRKVFTPMGATLVDEAGSRSVDGFASIDAFALDLEKMGADSLFLLLLPPPELRHFTFTDDYLDRSRSNVIEVGRCYIRDGLIREARFWYEPAGERQDKRHGREFDDWATAVYRKTKFVLERRVITLGKRNYKEWFGPVAWASVNSGLLRPAGAA